jgi:nucleoid DNA-binding protein/cell division septation protein DedD
MNKEELVNQISEELNLSKIDVSNFIDDIFSTIQTALIKGKSVNISEFGKFIPQKKTIEGVKQNSVSFSPVKKFSHDVNHNFNNLKPVTVALIPHSSGKLQEVFEEFDEEDINEDELIDVITEEPEEEVKTELEIAPYIEPPVEPEPVDFEEQKTEEEDTAEEISEERQVKGEEIVIEDNPEEQDVFYEDRISDILIVDDKENGDRLSDEEKPVEEISEEFVPYRHVEEDYNEILNRLIEENKPEDEEISNILHTEETAVKDKQDEGETRAEITADEEITDFAIPPQLREQNTITPSHEEITEQHEAVKEEPEIGREKEEPAFDVSLDDYKDVDKDVPPQDIMKLIEERKKILEEIKRLSEEKTLSAELPSFTGREEPKKEEPPVKDEPEPRADTIGSYLEEAETIDTRDKDIKEEEEIVLPPPAQLEPVTDAEEIEEKIEEQEEAHAQEEEEPLPREEKDDDILIPDFSFDKIFHETSDEELYTEPRETEKDEEGEEADEFDGGDILLPEDIKSLHDEIETPASKEEAYLTTDDNFKLKDYDDVFEQKQGPDVTPPPGIDFTKPEYKNFPGGPGDKAEDDKVFKKSVIVLVVVIAIVFSGLYYMYSTGLFSNGSGSKDTTNKVTPPPDNQIKVEKQQQAKDTVKQNTQTKSPPQTQETRKDTVTTAPPDNTPEEQIFDAQRNLIFIKKGNDFYIQAGSYKERAAAEEKLTQLKGSGINAVIAEADIEGKGKFYRVRIGKYTSLEEAKTAADNL